MNSNYPLIGCIIMAYDKKFKSFMKNALKSRRLTVAEALVLLSLYEVDGKTQDGLLDSIYYDKSVMARTMQSLEKRDLISRVENPSDKRSWLFYLTDEGRSMKPDIVKALRDWCDLVFDGIDDEETAGLLATMEKMQMNINKE